MTGMLRELTASRLARALEENNVELFRCFRHWPRAQVHEDDAIVWSLTDIDFPLFNNVPFARLAPAGADAAIEAAVARCRARDVPMLWCVGPLSQPDDLAARLLARGFVQSADMPGMAIDLAVAAGAGNAVDAQRRIAEVLDADAMRTWSAVFTSGFGLGDAIGAAFHDCLCSFGFGAGGPLHHYLGCLDGRAVGTATLFVAAGVAGVYNVAAIPDARRCGVGAAMTAHALAQARSLGCHAGVLFASAMGESVYRKLGFLEVCRAQHYVLSRAGKA